MAKVAVAALVRAAACPPQCPLYLCPPLEALEEGGLPLTLGLEGEHQRPNAALALQLAHCWLQWQERRGEWLPGTAGGQCSGSLPWGGLSTAGLAPHRPQGAEDIHDERPLSAAPGPGVPAHVPHAAW